MEFWINLKKGASGLFQPDSDDQLYKLFRKSARVKEKSGGNSMQLAEIYGRIGANLLEKKDYSAAVTFFQLAADIFEFTGEADPDAYAQCLLDLGIACLHIRDEERSVEYIQKALETQKKRSGIYSELYAAFVEKIIRIYEGYLGEHLIPSEIARSTRPAFSKIDRQLSNLYLDSCAILKKKHGLTNSAFIGSLMNFKVFSSGNIPEPFSEEIREFLRKNDISGKNKQYNDARNYLEMFCKDEPDLSPGRGRLDKFDELHEKAVPDPPQALNNVYGNMLGAMGSGKTDTKAEIQTPEGSQSDQEATMNQVSCSLFSVPEASPGDDILIQLFAHLPGDAIEVKTLAKEFDPEATLKQSRTFEIEKRKEVRLTFELEIPDLTIDDPVQQIIWKGITDSVQYIIRVPGDFQKTALLGKVRVACDMVPVGHFCFKIGLSPKTVSKGNNSPELTPMKNYRYAFISYASGDRAEVMRRVQMLDMLKIRYFQDVLNLSPGDRWDKELYKHIELADVFFLFWSSAARDSEWVLKEVDYAMNRQKEQDELPEIYPVILEGPPIVEPPEKLKHLHFNDRILYFM